MPDPGILAFGLPSITISPGGVGVGVGGVGVGGGGGQAPPQGFQLGPIRISRRRQ